MTEMVESTLAGRDQPETISGEISILITTDHDILNARQKTRWFAEQIGFRGSWPTILSTVISGLARNTLMSARHGNIVLQSVWAEGKRGILIIMNDKTGTNRNLREPYRIYQLNPPFVETVTSKYYSARRVADRFEVGYDIDGGTALKVLKWL